MPRLTLDMSRECWSCGWCGIINVAFYGTLFLQPEHSEANLVGSTLRPWIGWLLQHQMSLNFIETNVPTTYKMGDSPESPPSPLPTVGLLRYQGMTPTCKSSPWFLATSETLVS